MYVFNFIVYILETVRCMKLILSRDIGYGLYVNVCASWCDLFALPKCVQLPYLRHLSLLTKIYGLLQLIIICTST